MMEYFERQYAVLDEELSHSGFARFGPMSSFTWNTDPKRLLFVLSRYKFAAKMLENCQNVLEVGCGDGFAARIVRQHVERLTISDADPIMIEGARTLACTRFPIEFLCHNFVTGPLSDVALRYDGAYLLDVLEHIDRCDEDVFIFNLKSAMRPGAKVVIGMPSAESQTYASPASKEGHINCKTKEELHEFLGTHFASVTCFSMNDEVVHTGFGRMSNYLIAVCVV